MSVVTTLSPVVGRLSPVASNGISALLLEPAYYNGLAVAQDHTIGRFDYQFFVRHVGFAILHVPSVHVNYRVRYVHVPVYDDVWHGLNDSLNRASHSNSLVNPKFYHSLRQEHTLTKHIEGYKLHRIRNTQKSQ